MLGIDNSPEMIAAARQNGIDALLVDVADMAFSSEFDAVFSNATLHWILEKERAARAIFRAVKPGGRFAGELGGEGNIARLRETLDIELAIRGYVPPTESSNWYPSPDEFAEMYEAAGFREIDARLIERPTPIDHGVDAWVHDLPPRLARSCASAGRGTRRHRRSCRRQVRLQRRRLCPTSLHNEEAKLMRYLPLSPADRSQMLGVIGAGSIDELFRDVPERLG